MTDATPGQGPLSPWDRVRIARHPERPHTLDYVRELATGFVELHGDRAFGDDHALIGGLASFGGRTVMIVGHQKGSNTRENIQRNFGMVRPEGYRKADRLMRHAEKFRIPIVSFIDTSGADPTLGSEERGQAIAIAESLLTMAALRTPIVALVIGEGGSGGAVAIATANRVLMMEHAIYSVISPEGAASILWRDAARAQDAATNMKITAQDLLRMGVIDRIVPEPVGGAHRSPADAVRVAGDAIEAALGEMKGLSPEQLRAQRAEKFLTIGRRIG